MKDKIKCNYQECAAGMGVAGNRCCFFFGDYKKSECPKFQSEDDFIKEMKAKADWFENNEKEL